MTPAWNLPVVGMFACQKCGKPYDTLIDRSCKRHACPHCGAIHFFDAAALEEKFRECSKKQFQKTFGKQ